MSLALLTVGGLIVLLHVTMTTERVASFMGALRSTVAVSKSLRCYSIVVANECCWQAPAIDLFVLVC